jgi:hypothetical protein
MKLKKLIFKITSPASYLKLTTDSGRDPAVKLVFGLGLVKDTLLIVCIYT